MPNGVPRISSENLTQMGSLEGGPISRITAPETAGPFPIVLADRTLSAYLARPAPSATSGSGRHGLVVCHGFPADPVVPDAPNRGYQQLADRLASDTGWVVLTVNFRGTSESTGNFSLGGWLADLKVATDVL